MMAAINNINADARYNTVINLVATYYDTQRSPILAGTLAQVRFVSFIIIESILLTLHSFISKRLPMEASH